METTKQNQTAKAIRSLRGKTGLSQARFGDLYNIPTRTIEDWESGARTPAAYLVELLARAVEEDKGYIIPARTIDNGSVDDADTSSAEFAIRVHGTFLTYRQVADAFNEAEAPDEPYTAEKIKGLVPGGYLDIYKDGAIMLYL